MAFSRNPNNRTIVAIPVLLCVAVVFAVLGALFSFLEGKTKNESMVISGTSDSAVADEFSKI